MSARLLMALACLGALAACAIQPKARTTISAPPTDSAAAPRAQGVPFVGLGLGAADDGGAVVRGMVAGPAASAGLRQGDRIVAVDGTELGVKHLRELLAASAPGMRFVLRVMREDQPLTIELVVGERSHWLGPIAYAAAKPFSAAGLDAVAHWPDPVVEDALAAVEQIAPISARLDRMFDGLARDDAGFHKLPLLRNALLRPGAVSDWRDKLLASVRGPQPDYRRIVDVLCETLALDCPAAQPDAPATQPSLAAFASTVAESNRRVREIVRMAGIDRAHAIGDLRYLLEKTAADRTLLRQPGVERGVRAMQSSMTVDLAALLAVLDGLLWNAQRLPDLSGVPRLPPAALSAMVRGEILGYAESDGGYVVIGGPGPNRYDMERLFAVIDVGGNDVYQWHEGVPAETQTLIDLAGNDRYEAAQGGPAAGWLGVAVLIDRAGDDRYDSAIGGCAAGALGFGVLFDDAGADTYRCARWSVGAAIYGGGVVVDGGEEADVYLSESFAQGVGGPRGFGLLVDAGGADFYRANGPVPSAYGTSGSFMGFSQGVGVGIRPYDTGGAGVLFDLGGDDRYEGGEFSQGGGYFWGVGLLHDESGSDLYYGNRYAQGFAAHQAFGMLSDLAGDDIYWAASAAGQGAAWDQSIAILFDGGGDDLYRAQSLSQGAAAQQARASLHDLAGDDIYRAMNNIAQGAAGENEYHFYADDPIHSLGVLLDASGADRYSTGLVDGETRLRSPVPARRNGGGVAGVAIDRD